MKTAILVTVILSAATAAADTKIIEYPDHYYVESTGVPGEKPVPSLGRNASPAKILPVIDDGNAAPAAMARPVTNFEASPQPVDPAERRASMDQTIQQLQRERSELLMPKEGETPDQVAYRQQEAAGKLRRINKLSSEMLKLPVQGHQ